MVRGTNFARRLADYVVLAHDPAVREQAVDFWELSQPHYDAVAAAVAACLGDHERLCESYRALAREPGSVAAYRRFARLAEGIPRDGLADIVAAADDGIFIDHWLGPGYTEPVPSVALSDLRPPRHSPSGAAAGQREALIVIPFGDDAAGRRLRNVLACLRALRDQSAEAGSYAVCVVEASDSARWREEIESAAECYLYAHKPGAFNKSWAVNVGVANSPVAGHYLCVLDSDILVDHDFVQRNVGRLRQGNHAAHLPFQWAFNLCESASSRAIRQRVLDGQPDVLPEDMRGFLKRGSPGGCLWVRADAFHQVGGFDERFEGWGGEDDDVDARLAQVGSFVRYDDPLVHLFHPRPVMTSDGAMLNAHIQQATWPRDSPFGNISRFES
jgi:hypothetical protein